MDDIFEDEDEWSVNFGYGTSFGLDVVGEASTSAPVSRLTQSQSTTPVATNSLEDNIEELLNSISSGSRNRPATTGGFDFGGFGSSPEKQPRYANIGGGNRNQPQQDDAAGMCIDLEKFFADISSGGPSQPEYNEDVLRDVLDDLVRGSGSPVGQIPSPAEHEPDVRDNDDDSIQILQEYVCETVQDVAPEICKLRNSLADIISDLRRVQNQNKALLYKKFLQQEYGPSMSNFEDSNVKEIPVTNLPGAFKPPHGPTKAFNIALHPPVARSTHDTNFSVAPIYDQYDLPFRCKRKTREWMPGELEKLEICIRRSICHRQIFLIDSSFYTKFLSMGFNELDLNRIHFLYSKFDKRLRVEVFKHPPSETLNAKVWKIIEDHFKEERNLVEEIVLIHSRDRKMPSITFYVPQVSKNNTLPVHSSIKVEDMINWKQSETRAIFQKHYDPEYKIDETLIDWMMVVKEMSEITMRIVSEESLKKEFIFALSDKYKSGFVTEKEILSVKTLVGSKRPEVLNWTGISDALGTRRLPLQIYHAYQFHLDRNNGCNQLTEHLHKVLYFELLKLIPHYGYINFFINESPSIKFITNSEELIDKYGLKELNLKGLMQNWKSLNPSFSTYEICLAEDALLVAALVQKRALLIQGKDFMEIETLLPWRYSSTWRNRAHLLFKRQPSCWTIEDDKILIEKFNQHGTSYKGIEDHFDSRSRKGCISRYKLLLEKLKDMSLEEYHLRYSRRSMNIKSMDKKLLEVANLLATVLFNRHNIPGSANQPFKNTMTGVLIYSAKPKLNASLSIEEFHNTTSVYEIKKTFENFEQVKYPWESLDDLQDTVTGQRRKFAHKPPTEDEMSQHFDTFSTQQLLSALLSVTEYLRRSRRTNDINNFREPVMTVTIDDNNVLVDDAVDIDKRSLTISDLQKPPYTLNGLDRRKFDATNPGSVASALHLRGIQLINYTLEQITTLSDWEQFIYMAYRSFATGWKVKRKVSRSGIPSDIELALIPYLNRIVVPPKAMLTKQKDPRIWNEEPIFELSTGYSIAIDSKLVEIDKRVQDKWLAHPTNTEPTKRKPVRKTIYKKQRKTAANARWEKERLRKAQIQTAVAKVTRYWDFNDKHVLENYYSITDTNPCFKKCILPDADWTEFGNGSGGPKLLHILDDHNYMKDYKKKECETIEIVAAAKEAKMKQNDPNFQWSQLGPICVRCDVIHPDESGQRPNIPNHLLQRRCDLSNVSLDEHGRIVLNQ